MNTKLLNNSKINRLVLFGAAAFLVSGFFVFSVQASGPFYVRPDGNSSCTGLVDAAYDATSTPTDCAFNTIQVAIGAASGGDTINVAAGDYSGPISVGKAVTLQANPGVMLTGQITIASDNVTVDGFDITNPTVGYGIVATDHSNLHITDNTLHDIGTTLAAGSAQAIYVKGHSTAVTDITITGNHILNVGNTNLVFGSSGSAKGIFIGDSDGALDIDGVTISNNTITGVAASDAAYPTGRGAYGIHVNHSIGAAATKNLTISGNTISNLDGLWAHAIGLEGNTPSAIVTGNVVTNLTDNKEGTDSLALFFEDNSGALTTSVSGDTFDGKVLSLATSTIAVDDAWVVLAGLPAANKYYPVLLDNTYYFYGINAFSKIQDAVNVVQTDGTINVAAGNYSENININKNVSLIGTLNGTDLASFLSPAANSPIITLAASGNSSAEPLLLKNLHIKTSDSAPASDTGKMTGIRVAPGVSLSHIKLDNVSVIGNNHVYPGLESGFDIAPDASLSDLVIINSSFKDLSYGFISGAITSSNPGSLNNIDISNTIFDNNSVKGFYTERLSNATFNNVTASNNGDIALSPSWASSTNAGIDINLKYGTYQNLVFNNLTITSNGIGSANGAGLTVKARGTGNDFSYSSVPATLVGLTVNRGIFTGNATGIRFGEPGKNNTGPTNVTVNNASVFGNTQFGLSNVLSGVIFNATNNWWGNESGPTNATTSPSGTGDSITDNVAFTPWYVNSVRTILSDAVSGDTITSPDLDIILGSAGVANLPSGIKNLVLSNDSYLDLSAGLSGDAVTLNSGDSSSSIVLTNSNNLAGFSASIPNGTIITGPSGWNGKITPPTFVAAPSGNAPSGFSVGSTVINVGSSEGTLTFSNPITLLLPGVTGVVGYKPAGSDTWVKITNACTPGSYDSPTGAVFPGECAISNGTDTKITTYHFTTFGSLTANPVSSGGGGGGGGGSGPIGVPVAGFTPTIVATLPSTPTAAPAGQVLGAATFNFTNDLSIGTRGDDVTELQNRLTQEGVYSGPVTGYFGPLTSAGVKAYQAKYGISKVGVVGPLTRAQLNGSQVAGVSTVNSDAVKARTANLQAQLTTVSQQLLQTLQANPATTPLQAQLTTVFQQLLQVLQTQMNQYK